jgi:hypothetical protein
MLLCIGPGFKSFDKENLKLNLVCRFQIQLIRQKISPILGMNAEFSFNQMMVRKGGISF